MKLSLATLGWLLVFCITGFAPTLIGAQTKVTPLAGIDFKSAPASAFYGELTVRESSANSSYAACGFGHGWLGVQELEGGKKTVVFSVSATPNSKLSESAAAMYRLLPSK